MSVGFYEFTFLCIEFYISLKNFFAQKVGYDAVGNVLMCITRWLLLAK